MNLQSQMIYNVIKNNSPMSLSDLKKYFNVSIYQGVDREDSREFMNDLNSLIESGYVVKSHDENGLIYEISENSLRIDSEI